MGLISVALALFPLFSRYIAPCFVASYVVLFLDIKNQEFNGFTEVILFAAMLLEMKDEWLLSVARKKTGSKKRHKNSKKGKDEKGKDGKGNVKENKSQNSQHSSAPHDHSRLEQEATEASGAAIPHAPILVPQREQLPTFIVGTSVVLGLVTYGIQGVVIGPIIFIVSKALYDNFGYDTEPPQHLQLAGLEAAAVGMEGTSVAAAAGLLTARRPVTSRGVAGTMYTGNYIANCLQEQKNRMTNTSGQQDIVGLSRQSSASFSASTSSFDSSRAGSLERSYSDLEAEGEAGNIIASPRMVNKLVSIAEKAKERTKLKTSPIPKNPSAPNGMPLLNLNAPTMPSTQFSEKLYTLAESAKERVKTSKLANGSFDKKEGDGASASASPNIAPASIMKKEEGGLTARKKKATFTN